MDESASVSGEQPRKLWLRALFMLVMCVAFYVAAWVLAVTAVVQLVMTATDGTSNERLRSFGRALARYLAQIAQFVTFDTEQAPFPFSDWPSAA